MRLFKARKALYYSVASICAMGMLSTGTANAQMFNGWAYSGGITLVTDYRFRGISQSTNDPAFQGSLSASKNGLTVSVWGSSVEGFADTELDFIVDYGFNYGENSINVGTIYYSYLGADDLGYAEAYATWSRSFDDWTVGLANYISPDFFGQSGVATYSEANASYAFSDAISVSGRYGWQYVEESSVYGVPDYGSWSLGVAYTPNKFTFGVTYEDTDLSDSECGDACDGMVVLSLSFPL